MNSKELWDSVKAITSMEPSKRRIYSSDDLQRANELHDFYLRFQTHDFSNECNMVLESPSDDIDGRPEVDSRKVQSLFRQLCTRKSSGPDNIPAHLLKTCAEELTPAWCLLF